MRGRLAVLILPVLEYLLLRRWIRDSLNVRVGWFSMTDYEFVLPCIAAALLYLWALERDRRLEITLHRFSIGIHLCFLFLFCGFNVLLALRGITFLSQSQYLLWWGLACLSFGSSLGAFVRPSFFLKNRFSWTLFPAAAVGLSFPISMHLGDSLWQLGYPLVTKPACALLGLVYDSEFRCAFIEPNVSLLHPDFKVILGRGCSGLEGLVFAISSLLVWTIIHGRSIGLRLWMTFLAINVAVFYFLNLFRIGVIFSMGVFLKDSPFVVELFHWHLGWILYGLAQAVLLSFFSIRARVTLRSFLSSKVQDLQVPRGSLFPALLHQRNVLILLSMISTSVASGCPADNCFSREDCSAGCACLNASEFCGPCSAIPNQAICEGLRNNEVCNWTGSACESLPTISEAPPAFRLGMILLSFMLPLFLATFPFVGKPT